MLTGKHYMKYLLFLSFVVFSVNSFADDSPSKESILKLAEKFQQTVVLNGVMDANIKVLKKHNPEVSNTEWKKSKEKFAVDRLVKLYQDNFTQKEIDTLISLYSNKELQKLEFKKALIYSQLMEEIRKWRLNVISK